MDTATVKETKPESLVNFEQEGLMIRSELAIEIVDQESYNLAVEKRTLASNWLKNARTWFKGMKDPAHAAWKKICTNENTVCDPVEAQVKAINTALVRFDAEQEQKRRAEQLRLQEEARKQAEEERIAQAAEMESQGVDKETIDAVLDAPIQHIAPVVAAPTYEKSKQVVYRDNWSGECVDLFELVKAVAKDKTKIGLLQVNQQALNKMAQALKETMVIPGCRAVNNKVVATGRG